MEEVLFEQEHLMGIRGEHSLVGDEPHPERGPDTIVESVTEEAAQDTGTPLSSDTTPPEQAMEQPMDVDNPQSPITASDDAFLTSTGELGVEAEMATLRVNSTPEKPEDDEGEASGEDAS